MDSFLKGHVETERTFEGTEEGKAKSYAGNLASINVPDGALVDITRQLHPLDRAL